MINQSRIKSSLQVLVTHTCNPNYLGSRDQEDRKPVQTNSLRDPISKLSNMKKDWQSGSSGRAPVWQA
jgi:hypothetical protein